MSAAPLATWKETVGRPLNVMPAGTPTLIALPAMSAAVAFSTIWMLPSGSPSPGTMNTGAASALVVTPALGVTWTVTMAGALVRAAKHVSPFGAPQLSGKPRSLTVNVNVSTPVNPGLGV